MQPIKWEFVDEPRGGDRFELPEADGFVVRITDVVDDEANEKIIVTYDIAEGPYAGIFGASDFAKRNTWLHEFEVGYGTEWNRWRNEEVDQKPFFKRFYRAIEESNPGYRFDGMHPQTFIGKLVGVVFKDYYRTNERGYEDHRWYFVRAHTADEIRAGAYKVPEAVDKRTKVVRVDAAGDIFDDDVPFR